VHCAFTSTENLANVDILQGAHVSGAGRLFLMLLLHTAQATVAVTVPSNSSLHEVIGLQTLLVSLAVVDVTQYCNMADYDVTVNTAVTSD
jgi:hypothetical protein